MLQSRSGDIKPENYIESWKQELNRPVQMRDVVVTLKFETGWRAALPEDANERVLSVLQRAGLADRFDVIRNEGITATLYGDTGLLRAIYGVDGELSPWRVFTHSDTGTVPIDVRPCAMFPRGDRPAVSALLRHRRRRATRRRR
ncbi:hypothetical protein AYM40_37035 (plasmid) [Paraburkholderia phytofirmans OLGA172]|uniref:Uncharacterized protein n=2 Tax=Paraburkholderia phytofirmans TaxID=261302 RepID=A0A160FXE3_9BURK|nr:hypothetical protein AYM40_37035 [Paraburkholderia phytofirmans OLGA172]